MNKVIVVGDYEVILSQADAENLKTFAPNSTIQLIKSKTGAMYPTISKRVNGTIKGHMVARIILDLLDKPDVLISYLDTNPCNLKRNNLLAGTEAEMKTSRSKSKTTVLTSKYLGVAYDKTIVGDNRWRAMIKPPGKPNKSLGRFPSEVLAAKAYDATALEYKGPYAN